MTTNRRNGSERGDPRRRNRRFLILGRLIGRRFGRSKKHSGLSEADRNKEDQDADKKR